MSKTGLQNWEEGMHELLYKTIVPNVVKYYNDQYNLTSTEEEVISKALEVKQVTFMTGTKSNSQTRKRKNVKEGDPGAVPCDYKTYPNNPKKGEKCKSWLIPEPDYEYEMHFCDKCIEKTWVKNKLKELASDSKNKLRKPTVRKTDLNKRIDTSSDSSSDSDSERPMRRKGRKNEPATTTTTTTATGDSSKKSIQKRASPKPEESESDSSESSSKGRPVKSRGKKTSEDRADTKSAHTDRTSQKQIKDEKNKNKNSTSDQEDETPEQKEEDLNKKDSSKEDDSENDSDIETSRISGKPGFLINKQKQVFKKEGKNLAIYAIQLRKDKYRVLTDDEIDDAEAEGYMIPRNITRLPEALK